MVLYFVLYECTDNYTSILIAMFFIAMRVSLFVFCLSMQRLSLKHCNLVEYTLIINVSM